MRQLLGRCLGLVCVAFAVLCFIVAPIIGWVIGEVTGNDTENAVQLLCTGLVLTGTLCGAIAASRPENADPDRDQDGELTFRGWLSLAGWSLLALAALVSFVYQVVSHWSGVLIVLSAIRNL